MLRLPILQQILDSHKSKMPDHFLAVMLINIVMTSLYFLICLSYTCLLFLYFDFKVSGPSLCFRNYSEDRAQKYHLKLPSAYLLLIQQ